MHSSFSTFRIFNDQESLFELVDLLKKNDIEYIVEDCTSLIDASLGNNNLGLELRLKLQDKDFAKVDDLLEQLYTPLIDNVEPDYYLLAPHQ